MKRLVAIVVALLVSGGAAAEAQQPVDAEPTGSSDPVLAPLMRMGRVIETARFTHRRRLRLYPSGSGVSHYAMRPDDLAAARADLADVRIVDTAGRQAPYVVTRARHLRVAVPSVGTGLGVARGSETHHTLKLPTAPLDVLAVELELDGGLFERSFRLWAERGDASTLVAAGRLRQEGVTVPIALRREARADALRLSIDDGDDAPLHLRNVTAIIAAADLHVLAPPGAYLLLVGGGDIEAPRYQLGRLSERVLAAPASEAQAGPLEPNPAYVAPGPSGADDEAFDATLVLWGAIAASMLILGVVTLRVVRPTTT